MSNDIETTDDTNAPSVVATVALQVGKELAITVAGCAAALALTSGAHVVLNKVRAFRAARKSDDADAVA